MKQNTYFLNILLTITVALTCLVMLLVRVFFPSVLLPQPGIPAMVLLTVLPLAVEHHLGAPKKREWIGSTALAGLTFSVLPLCAGITAGPPVWLLLVCGAAVFAVCTALYSSMSRRMASGPSAKAAPAINALLLFLAAQIFQGVL